MDFALRHRGVGVGCELPHFFHHLGMLCGDVGGFADVLGKVVEFPGTFRALAIGFPIAHADGGLVADFPVEVGMLRLLAADGLLAEQLG